MIGLGDLSAYIPSGASGPIGLVLLACIALVVLAWVLPGKIADWLARRRQK